jgi:hypothetical protein
LDIHARYRRIRDARFRAHGLRMKVLGEQRGEPREFGVSEAGVKLYLYTFATYCDEHGLAWPGQTTLGPGMGVGSRNTVSRTLGFLLSSPVRVLVAARAPEGVEAPAFRIDFERLDELSYQHLGTASAATPADDGAPDPGLLAADAEPPGPPDPPDPRNGLCSECARGAHCVSAGVCVRAHPVSAVRSLSDTGALTQCAPGAHPVRTNSPLNSTTEQHQADADAAATPGGTPDEGGDPRAGLLLLGFTPQEAERVAGDPGRAAAPLGVRCLLAVGVAWGEAVRLLGARGERACVLAARSASFGARRERDRIKRPAAYARRFAELHGTDDAWEPAPEVAASDRARMERESAAASTRRMREAAERTERERLAIEERRALVHQRVHAYPAPVVRLAVPAAIAAQWPGDSDLFESMRERKLREFRATRAIAVGLHEALLYVLGDAAADAERFGGVTP